MRDFNTGPFVFLDIFQCTFFFQFITWSRIFWRHTTSCRKLTFDFTICWLATWNVRRKMTLSKPIQWFWVNYLIHISKHLCKEYITSCFILELRSRKSSIRMKIIHVRLLEAGTPGTGNRIRQVRWKIKCELKKISWNPFKLYPCNNPCNLNSNLLSKVLK